MQEAILPSFQLLLGEILFWSARLPPPRLAWRPTSSASKGLEALPRPTPHHPPPFSSFLLQSSSKSLLLFSFQLPLRPLPDLSPPSFGLPTFRAFPCNLCLAMTASAASLPKAIQPSSATGSWARFMMSLVMRGRSPSGRIQWPWSSGDGMWRAKVLNILHGNFKDTTAPLSFSDHDTREEWWQIGSFSNSSRTVGFVYKPCSPGPPRSRSFSLQLNSVNLGFKIVFTAHSARPFDRGSSPVVRWIPRSRHQTLNWPWNSCPWSLCMWSMWNPSARSRRSISMVTLVTSLAFLEYIGEASRKTLVSNSAGFSSSSPSFFSSSAFSSFLSTLPSGALWTSGSSFSSSGSSKMPWTGSWPAGSPSSSRQS